MKTNFKTVSFCMSFCRSNFRVSSSGFCSGERIDALMKCAVIWEDWLYFGHFRFIRILSFGFRFSVLVLVCLEVLFFDLLCRI